MINRWQEIFEGDDRRKSMNRVTLGVACLVSSLVLLLDTCMEGEINTTAFNCYMAIFSGTYIVGKGVGKWKGGKAR